MIEWRFMPLSTVFHLYHADSSHFSCLSWVSPGLGWRSEVFLLKDTSTKKKKKKRIQFSSNPRPLDYESTTPPLSQSGLLCFILKWEKKKIFLLQLKSEELQMCLKLSFTRQKTLREKENMNEGFFILPQFSEGPFLRAEKNNVC